MRILITGANGMLGQDLVPLLATRHEVRACGHADCDITDQVSVSRVFADASPQLVINCAAMADVDGCERDPARAMAVNARGAGNVARAAEGIGARVFHISTDYVFDGAKRRPYTEQDPVNPLSVYAHSKLEGERMVLYAASAPSPHLIIRTSWLYGRHRTNFVDKTVENAKATISLGSEIPYATVSSAGTQVQFKEALLKLDVTPTVIREGNVTKVKMVVNVENNSRGIDVNTASGPVPSINRRNAITQVVVKEGETLVIGGIRQREEAESLRKVPLFGDIPVLGYLFRAKARTTDPNRELVVFITPYVLTADVAQASPPKQ